MSNNIFSHLTNTKNFRLSKNHEATNLFINNGGNNKFDNRGLVGDSPTFMNKINASLSNEDIRLNKGNKININLVYSKKEKDKNDISNIIEEE